VDISVEVETVCEEVSKREVVVSMGRLLVSILELEVCCSEVVVSWIVDGNSVVDDKEEEGGGATVVEEEGGEGSVVEEELLVCTSLDELLEGDEIEVRVGSTMIVVSS